jgi:hypothetical protein
MRCESESRELRLACADTTLAIREKLPTVPVLLGRFDLVPVARLMPVRSADRTNSSPGELGMVAPYELSIERILPIWRWMLGVERWTFFCATT